MKDKPIHPGSLVTLSENRKYSGVVISRSISKDYYKDSMGLEPYQMLEVLWNIDGVPLGECGSLGIGSGPLRVIIEDLVELVV